MRAVGDTRTPSVSTTSPSTFTQPLVIQRSASRREHRPSSLMRLERRGCSELSGDGGGRVTKWRIVAAALKHGITFLPRVCLCASEQRLLGADVEDDHDAPAGVHCMKRTQGAR